MNRAKQRYDRLRQQKHRNSKMSYKTELENALLMLAWEAGGLTEGQVVKALGWGDRIDARNMRMDMAQKGADLFDELRQRPK